MKLPFKRKKKKSKTKISPACFRSVAAPPSKLTSMKQKTRFYKDSGILSQWNRTVLYTFITTLEAYGEEDTVSGWT